MPRAREQEASPSARAPRSGQRYQLFMALVGLRHDLKKNKISAKGIDYTHANTAQGGRHQERCSPVMDGGDPAPHLSKPRAQLRPHHPSRNWKYGLGLERGCRFTPLFFQTNLLVL